MPHAKSVLLVPSDPLHLLKDTLLELTLHLLALLVRSRLAVESQERAQVELGLLQQLDLADVNLYIMSASSHPAGERLETASRISPSLRIEVHVRSAEGRCPG